MCPVTGLEHVEAAQPTPAPHRLRNTATHTATNTTLPQVQELCLKEPCALMLQQGWPQTAAQVSAPGPGQGVHSPATNTCDTPGEQDPLCQAAALESCEGCSG